MSSPWSDSLTSTGTRSDSLTPAPHPVILGRQDGPSLIRMETFVAGERAMLERMLDLQREELARLLSEVDDTAARARLVPSLTTPLGLVKHATFVEKVWFHSRVAGVPRAELGLPDTIDESFVLEPDDTVDSVRAGPSSPRASTLARWLQHTTSTSRSRGIGVL